MIRRFWLAPAVALVCMIVLGISAQTQEKDKSKDAKAQKDTTKEKGKEKEATKEKEKQKEAEKEKEKTKEKEKQKEAEKGTGATGTLAWKALEDKGKSFLQKLKTETTQNMSVSGMKNVQEQNQTFWFEWTPLGKTDDGLIKVEQKIIGLVMDINIGGNKIGFNSGDKEQKKNPMTQFFKSLEGAKFTLTIDPKTWKVKEVKGVQAMVDKLSQVNQSMKPLLEKILSEEAVKQMANPVLGVVPEKGEIPKDKKWGGKAVTLDMGPIGSYITTNTYTLEGEKDKIATIKVSTDLQYKAPTKEEAKGLPFTIESATLKSKDSGGEIKFNEAKGRIESSDLKVRLEGELKVNIANTNTVVQLEQNQTVQLQTYDPDAKDVPQWVKDRLKEKEK